MNEKDLIKKLEEFVADVNDAVDSYISSHSVMNIQMTLRIRSVIEIDYNNGKHGRWIFKDEQTCERIHKRLKELLVMREMLGFKKQLDEDKDNGHQRTE